MVILVMYYVFQKFPAICYQSIKCHSGESKNVMFTPHQVVIKNLKILKMSLLLELLMILPGCTNLTTLGHHLFLQFLLVVVITQANFGMSILDT